MSPLPAGQTFEQWHFVLLSTWSGKLLALALCVALLAVALSAWGYRRQRLLIRFALVGLRLLAIAAVLVLVLQPAFQVRSVTRLPNHVALLADTSRSMRIRDRPGQTSRIERLRAVFSGSAERLESWRKDRKVESFRFDAALEHWGGDPGDLAAEGAATDVRAALEQLGKRYSGDDLAGIVLVSDGIDNGAFGTETLTAAQQEAIRRLGAPIHTLWVGEGEMRDVAVSAVHADDFAFVRNVVKVEVDLVVTGIDEERIAVSLATQRDVVETRWIPLERDKTRYRVSFQFAPQKVGRYLYAVSTPLLSEEAVSGNNSRAFILNVIRDRVRVLQLCGRPSWDQRFLRQLLKRDPNTDLISFFILRTPASLSFASTDELSLIPFPTEELFRHELGSFDLIILQNFDYGPYGIGAYLSHIRRYVEGGGGLVMVGGDLSFSSGGYAGTPIAAVLPVRLPRPEGGGAPTVSTTDFRPHVTRRGGEHPILQFGGVETGKGGGRSRGIASGLPPLSGVNLVGGPMREAVVLATHPVLKTPRGDPMPVLAVRSVGQGRSMAFTTDSSWYWAFPHVGRGGTRGAYERFWRNAIRWLIRDPELQYLRIVVQREKAIEGAALQIVLRAYNPDYTPAIKQSLSYVIAPPAGGEGVARRVATDDQGEVALTYRPPVRGAYRIQAETEVGGRKSKAEELFLVEPTGPEDRRVRPTPRLLEQLAEVSGGRYMVGVDTLPELDFKTPRTLRVNWRRDVELWSSGWSLALIVLLLAAEWIVRRRFGHF